MTTELKTKLQWGLQRYKKKMIAVLEKVNLTQYTLLTLKNKTIEIRFSLSWVRDRNRLRI